MGKLRSERERSLQRKLIPVNILICILALVAALSLFLGPLINVDAGKILRDKGTMEFVDEKIGDIIGGEIDGTEQEDIDYKPVVTALVKQILGSAEGEIKVSGYSAFRVLVGSEDKAQKVLDELLFGKDALATKLIDSVVDAVANIFKTDEGKAVLEEAIVSTMTKQVIKNVDEEEVKNALTPENVKELVGIMRELSDPEKVPDGKVDGVAGRYIDKFQSMLGDEIVIEEADRQSMINEVQKLYDQTLENLKEGEVVSMESIICVTVSKNFDLSKINIEDLLGNFIGDKNENGGKENSLHRETVEGEAGGVAPPDGEDAGSSGDGGSSEGETGSEVSQKVVTNYDDLLIELGYNEEKKEELKENMRTSLNDALNGVIEENGIKDYLAYYGYLAYAMLAFMLPWIILFLFSFFHMLAKNKRFTMWYAKLFGWIPALIWLVFTLFPVLAPKLAPRISVINDLWNGENSVIIKAAFTGLGTLTWISGLCYLLMWFISIFWAFPIKRKIRKERKYPQVEDAYDEEEY